MKIRPLLPLLLACSVASAQHAHDHDHDHDGPAAAPAAPPVEAAPFDAPSSFTAAVELLTERSEALTGLVEQGIERTAPLAAAQAAAVRDVARRLVRLAMQKDSGYPPEKIRDLLAASRELAERADRAALTMRMGLIDESGHAAAEVASGVAGVRRLANMSVGGAPASSSPYTVEIITTPARIRPGEEAGLQWIVRGPDGEQVERFELIDGEHMHLVVVSRGGSFVYVDTPQLRVNHRFTLALTLPEPGEYVFFQEFRPAGAAAQVVASVVSAPGAPPEAPELALDAAPKATGAETATIILPSELVAGREAEIRVRVVDDASKSGAKLQPVRREEGRAGGYGRLTAAHAGAQAAVFVSADGASAPERGELVFRATFPEAGKYRAEVLFQHKLYLRRAAWVFEVAPAPATTE